VTNGKIDTKNMNILLRTNTPRQTYYWSSSQFGQRSDSWSRCRQDFSV